MSKPFIFTTKDGQNLVAIAESAPLANMKAAKEVNDIIARFAVFFDAAMEAIEFQRAAEAKAAADLEALNKKLADTSPAEPPAP